MGHQNMNISPIFSSFTVTEHLNYDICDQCNSLLKNKEQYFLNGSEFKELYDDVNEIFNKVGKNVLGINEKFELKINDCWLNKGGTKHITEPHCHPGHILSAVYYVKSDPFISKLRFLTTTPIIAEKLPQTRRDSHVNFFNEYNSSVWDVNSVEGMLVVFPSWLYHYVIGAEESRISLAFNCNISVV